MDALLAGHTPDTLSLSSLRGFVFRFNRSEGTHTPGRYTVISQRPPPLQKHSSSIQMFLVVVFRSPSGR